MPAYRSKTSTHGRNMAGARALWRATGMQDGDFKKPIIAVANAFTQFVPSHVHLQDLAQLVCREIEHAYWRERKVSTALKAYALLATSADRGGVRDLTLLGD